MKKMKRETYPSYVRSTKTITDEDRVCAEAGEIGAVLYGELHEDGTLALRGC